MKIKLLNANDAALFVKTCNEFQADIDIKYGRYIIDAKSIMGVLSTGLNKEYEIEIYTEDHNEKEKFIEAIKLWTE